MDVTFDVEGTRYELGEKQATILAENLRVLSKSEFVPSSEPTLLATDDWRPAAEALADSIEVALVDGGGEPLKLEGGAANATYCVLRLMAGIDQNGGTGLRNALGAPVEERMTAGRLVTEPLRHLSRPELVELLVILFILAVLTIVAGIAWTGTWWVLAPVIAALLGLRVATTRASGRFAWSVASVIWWAIFLIPAAVLVTLVAFLIVAVIK